MRKKAVSVDETGDGIWIYASRGLVMEDEDEEVEEEKTREAEGSSWQVGGKWVKAPRPLESDSQRLPNRSTVPSAGSLKADTPPSAIRRARHAPVNR